MSAARRLKVLHIDIGGCEGCGVTVLRALPLIEKVAEVRSKYLGSVKIDGESYDVAIVTGSVCLDSEESIEKLKAVREVSEYVIALGSCASVGGVTLFSRGGQRPRPEHRVWQPISSVIKVDYAVPGCPPPPQVLTALIEGISYRKGVMESTVSKVAAARKAQYFMNLFGMVAKVRKLSGFDLIDDVVFGGLCIGCGACVLSCPTCALRLVDKRPDIVPERCIRCGTCYVRCPKSFLVLSKRVGDGK